jgi:hypothetical protein
MPEIAVPGTTRCATPGTVYPEELGKRSEQLLIAFRPSMCKDVEAANVQRGAVLIYSLWPGYLDQGTDDVREIT